MGKDLGVCERTASAGVLVDLVSRLRPMGIQCIKSEARPIDQSLESEVEK